MAKKKIVAKVAGSLLSTLRDNTTLAHTSILSESALFAEKDVIDTGLPMVNVALSGKLAGGLVPGHTMFAGQSKHFKTAFALILAAAYLNKYKDAVLMFYDSEFGSPQSYFDTFGIDMDRTLHCPITNVEELKFDIMQQLEKVARGDHVVIVIDSIGNLASKKEVEDALSNNSSADFTRAKQLKSLFRMVTPHLNLKNIPLITVNHTYKTIEMFSKDVVGGGTGSYYSADNIFIVGRQQEKEQHAGKKELVGWNFILNAEKSRYVREKSKIPITVRFEGGISKWTGLLEVAQDGGFVVPVKKKFSYADPDTGEVNEDTFSYEETETSAFWRPILANTAFQKYITNRYAISQGDIITDEEVDKAYGDA